MPRSVSQHANQACAPQTKLPPCLPFALKLELLKFIQPPRMRSGGLPLAATALHTSHSMPPCKITARMIGRST